MSQFARFTPIAPGPSNSRSTFPSLSVTVILTFPSFLGSTGDFPFSSVVPFPLFLSFCCRSLVLILLLGLRRLGRHGFLQVIVQKGAVRRIFRSKKFLPSAPAPHPDVENGSRVWRKERQITVQHAGVHLFDWRDVVKNPYRAPVRG